MSSHDEGSSGQPSKKKRIRACDQCRRRKVRCDGSEIQSKECSNCVAFGYVCTYLTGPDKRHLDPDYVRDLESEVTRLRLQVQKLQNDPCPRCAFNDARDTSTPSSTDISTPIIPTTTLGSPTADADSDGEEVLVEGFKSLSVDAKPIHFLGRSSNFTLIKAARDLKQQITHNPSTSSPGIELLDASQACPTRRPEFWELALVPIKPDPPYTNFPESALLDELVAIYFQSINAMFPLLHRPTFERGISSGLHLRDEGFGAVVLLVCALSARFYKQPIALPPEAPNWHWAGWQWFEQVRERRKLVPLLHTRLYDLQIAALAAGYVSPSPASHSNYAIVGHGIRLAQDLGAHRRTTYPAKPTVESELRKRAFWLLVAMDRGMCSVLGRPCTIQDEDFDVDYPTECDDEYWELEDPELAWKQPPGKPSTTTYFILMLKLAQVHGYTLRTLYSLRGSKVLSDPERAQAIVSQLDSELNKWQDSVPEHLRWDPLQPNDLWASQSASLFAAYHAMRIFVHRPFIPMPRKPAPLPFPSLTICTSAARSCIQVLDKYLARFGPAFLHNHHQLTLFTSTLILLLNIWGGSRTGATVDVAKEMEEVNRALNLLKQLEGCWISAGRFWDLLHDLMTAVDPAQQQLTSSRAQKRRREDDASEDTSLSPFAPAPSPTTATNGPQQPPETLPFVPPPFDGAPPAPAALPSVDFTFNTGWQAPAPQGAGQPFGAGATGIDGAVMFDPDIEAIFADLLPNAPSYEDPFQGMTLFPNYIYDGTDVAGGLAQGSVFSPLQSESPGPVWGAGMDGTQSSATGPRATFGAIPTAQNPPGRR
ncbi:Zn(II)2Cys6 transcription factor [Phanerochaete sordida]|uniref:Zn(II)2Cys6 transcription factor n=1 Tax=Phanerochaete sordida TaxID=48140 RepID=A0A9P3G5U4_9APHY|nr:Zn(II)2Cys6 transcription factor [Phanerochaete sordida]